MKEHIRVLYVSIVLMDKMRFDGSLCERVRAYKKTTKKLSFLSQKISRCWNCCGTNFICAARNQKLCVNTPREKWHSIFLLRIF